MEAKQKAIQAAYGDAWEKVKDYVDENGWCEPGHDMHIVHPVEFDPFGTDRWRPFILSGIEDNNGWIRCEDKIPEDGQIIHKFMFGGYFYPSRFYRRWDTGLTHWKLASKEPDPIY